MRPLRPRLALLVSLLVGLGSACSELADQPIEPSYARPSADPTVTSTDPAKAGRDTTLNVRVLGTGYDQGSQVDFLLGGAADPKVVTNSTQFVRSTELVANITIAADAVLDFRDVAVTTSGGKKGIGTSKFEVALVYFLATGLSGATSYGVNTLGQATGVVYPGDGGACQPTAFVWTAAGGLAALPKPAGQCFAYPGGITETGIVVGRVGDATYGEAVAIWRPSGPGTWTLETLAPPEPPMGGIHINEAGTIFFGRWVWQNGGGWTALAPTAGATSCSAQGMNEAGAVVGSCSGGTLDAVYWASPTAAPVLLPKPAGGSAYYGYGINDAGVIVGVIGVATGKRGTTSHAARWTPNGSGGWLLEDLGSAQGGSAASRAKAINNQGDIVGSSGSEAFLWTPESGFRLLGVFTGGGSSSAWSLSDRMADGKRWIVGEADLNGGVDAAVAWKR